MSLVLPDPEKPPIVQCPHCHTGLGSIGTMIEGSLAVMVHNEPHCNAVLGVQLIAPPQQSEPLIAVPSGRLS